MRIEEGGSGSLVPAIFGCEGGVDTTAVHVAGWAWQVGLLICTSHDRRKYGYWTTEAAVVEEYSFHTKRPVDMILCNSLVWMLTM